MGHVLHISTPASIVCVFLNISYLSVIPSYLPDEVAPHFSLLCNPSEAIPLAATRQPLQLLAQVSTTQYSYYCSLPLRQLQVHSRGAIIPHGLLLCLSSINSLTRFSPNFSERKPAYSFEFHWHILLLEISLNSNLLFASYNHGSVWGEKRKRN